jgi:hypothetical protein
MQTDIDITGDQAFDDLTSGHGNVLYVGETFAFQKVLSQILRRVTNGGGKRNLDRDRLKRLGRDARRGWLAGAALQQCQAGGGQTKPGQRAQELPPTKLASAHGRCIHRHASLSFHFVSPAAPPGALLAVLNSLRLARLPQTAD